MTIQQKDLRIAALKRFAMAITVLVIAGHVFLGFEQSLLQVLFALATAYSLEICFEYLLSRLHARKPRYAGGWKQKILFLLPAHITALAVSMLLYANDKVMPIIFATAVAILSKYIFRIVINNRSRHFFNPSNFGIAITLILFPWVGIAPPYMFTENIAGAPDWVFPAIIVVIGSLLNIIYTKKILLILGWLLGFFAQVVIRSLFWDATFVAALVPMSGIAFLLFTFYMVSDPGTTPMKKGNQFVFGLSVAAVYGLLVIGHIVFGLFFALTIVCVVRGLYFFVLGLVPQAKIQQLQKRSVISIPERGLATPETSSKMLELNEKS